MDQSLTTSYTEFVSELIKPGQDILLTLDPLKVHLWHMSSCICGEAAEILDGCEPFFKGRMLDHDNLVEELGDIEFYLEGYRQGAKITREESEAVEKGRIDSLQESLTLLVIAAGDLFDTTKRHILYEKPFGRDKAVVDIAGLEFALEQVRLFAGLSREEILEGNIRKLRKRYPKGYTNASAQARVDKLPEVFADPAPQPPPAHCHPN